MARRGKNGGEGANTGSSRTRMSRIIVLTTLLLLAAAVVFGSLWLNREREPMRLAVATGPFGTDAYSLMREIQEVVERHSDTLRIDIRASRDASQNIALLNRGEIDAAVIRADTPVVANVRVIAGLYPDMFQVIARDDSNIWLINNLANARVSIPEFGSDGFRSFWVIADHYDLPIDRMKWTAEEFSTGARKLLAGETDVFFTVRSLRDTKLIRMFEDAQLKGLKLRFIPINQAEAVSIKRPFLSSGAIPQGVFTGATPVPSVDTATSVVDRILVTRDDVDAEAVRELTRILFEHRLDLTIRNPLASEISAPDLAQGLSVPLHEGAEAFYNRDQPSFIQENAEPLALGVTVLTILFSSLLALRSRFTSSQKNRADTYNYELLDIQKRAMLEDDPEELAGLKIELNNILQTVVIALDTDEVTDEGFQSFSLLWDAVRETINDRQKALSAAA